MKLNKTRIRADITGGLAVVRFLFTHVKDASDVMKIVDEIMEVARNYSIQRLIVNFGGLTHLTSSFLSKLITLNKQLAAIGVELHVCQMSPEVERAFKLCNLQKLIPLHDSEEKAVK